jgi:hypothetical protein
MSKILLARLWLLYSTAAGVHAMQVYAKATMKALGATIK